MRKAIQTELVGKTGLNVLDVGCGHKPFYPFLKPYAGKYVGTDIISNSPAVDIVCPAEQLQIEDGWADLAICLSVLEHVDDPVQAVKELHRVTKPNGVVFAVTHGCFPWHPYPQDHWRWTQTGLPLLFTKYGQFKSVNIFASYGTFSGMGLVLSHFFHSKTVSGGAVRRFLGRQMIVFSNRIAEYLDMKFPEMSDVNRHVTAIPAFFVIAKKE